MVLSLKVELRYCGGCNPGYDRVEYAERIHLAAGERISWVGLEEAAQVVLLVSGCPRACVLAEFDQARRVVSLIDDEKPPQRVVDILLEKGSGDEDRD